MTQQPDDYTVLPFNDAHQCVSEFMQAFDASLDPLLWCKLVEEETAELLDAIAAEDKVNALKELTDLAYVVHGFNMLTSDYVDFGVCVSKHTYDRMTTAAEEAMTAHFHAIDVFGFTQEQAHEALKRVHASNMSKLGDDGKPIKREDGKIMKGPNYREPDLTDLV